MAEIGVCKVMRQSLLGVECRREADLWQRNRVEANWVVGPMVGAKKSIEPGGGEAQAVLFLGAGNG